MVRSRVNIRFFIVAWLGVFVLSGISPGRAQSPEEHIHVLETALRTQPNDAPTLVALGRLYVEEAGMISDGLKLLEQAVAIAPHDPSARVVLGSIQVQMARTTTDPGEQLRWAQKGMRTMDEAVEAFPTVAFVYMVRGFTGVGMPDLFRRYVLAIQDLHKVLELKTQDPAAVADERMPLVYLNLGLAYKKNNQTAEARTIWEKGRQRYPQAKEAVPIEQ